MKLNEAVQLVASLFVILLSFILLILLFEASVDGPVLHVVVNGRHYAISLEDAPRR